jgi:hypothetical protein
MLGVNLMYITRNTVSCELKLIRKYFGNWKTKLSAEQVETVRPLADKYNKAISSAAPWAYKIYHSIYVMGITGERLAEEYDCSPEYMRRRIKQVKDYFVEVFKNEEN